MTKQIANAYGLLAIVLWAVSALLISYTDGIPPMLTACLVYLVGSMIYTGKIINERKKLSSLLNQSFAVYTILIGGLGAYYTFYYLALKLSPIIQANLITYLWPLFLIMLNSILGEKTVKLPSWIGIILGFSGAFILISKGEIRFSILFSADYSLAFFAAMAAAIYSFKLTTIDFDRDFFAIVFVCLTIITALLHIGFDEPTPEFSMQNILAILFLAASTFATTLWSYGMRYGSTDHLANAAYLIPLLSTVLLVIFERSQMTFNTWIGGALIISGVLLSMIGQIEIWKKWRTR